MIGGKGLCTAYFVCLHTPVPGPGNNGGAGKKFIAFRSMSNLNMIIPVYALAVHVLYIKE